MGEVYRARDTNLGRDVAIKVLPDAFADDAERLARFEREAKVLASLNDPYIAHVYGLERMDAAPGARPVRALVMELVEGPTLADRIAHGPVPTDEALPIARQIAEALEAAHAQNVIHRDLKPANVKVRPDGTVKVLDFGLAKALDSRQGDARSALSASAMTQSPTLTSPVGVTGVGVLLGTAAYMAPEQAKGRAVSRATDIWAFGCVLFEMLSGKRVFTGEDVSDTLAAVLRAEPDWSALPADLPPSIRRLLRRCLQKDSRNRLADIADARLEIDDVLNGSREEISKEQTTATSVRRQPVLLLSALAVVTLVAIGAIVWAMRAPAVEQAPLMQLQLLPPDDVTIPSGLPQISPDGRLVAFVGGGRDGRSRAYVRALDTLDARPLAGTEGVVGAGNTLIWSPDSRQLAFQVGTIVKKVAIAGDLPQSLCDLGRPISVVGGSWNRDGVIILGMNDRTGIKRVAASGGRCESLTRTDASEVNHLLPAFLPDGRHFLYLRTKEGEADDLYVGSLDAAPERQKLKMVLSAGYGAQYVPAPSGRTGRILFVRDATLFAQPFDPDRLELSGDAVPIAGKIGTRYDIAYFSASTNGTLVYRTSDSNDVQLTWFDRHGRAVAEVGDPIFPDRVWVSPDGSQAAFTSLIPPYGHWVMDLNRGIRRRLGFEGGGLSWSSDAQYVAYSNKGLYRWRANSAEDKELLLDVNAYIPSLDWSRDGRFLLYATVQYQRQSDIWALPLDGNRKPFAVAQTDFAELEPKLSPDSRWVAYISDESGSNEIHIRPFVPPSTSRASNDSAAQIVSKGGVASMLGWRDDGKELWFVTADLKIMSVELTPEPKFQATEPKLLFEMPSGTRAQSTDGDRFLLAVPTKRSTQVPITVVQNWPALMKN
jgi:eukaryotic-like serine/threonine-protein kinase